MLPVRRTSRPKIMASNLFRIFATVLLLLQSVTSLARGGAMCIPIACGEVHEVAQRGSCHSACSHHASHHGGESNHQHRHASAGQAHGDHVAFHPSSSHDSCGCHIHIELSGLELSSSSNAPVVPAIRDSLAVRIASNRPIRDGWCDPLDADLTWARSDQRRVIDVASIVV